MMRKFIKRLFIFLIPFFMICLTNTIIDPFNMFKSFSLNIDKKSYLTATDTRLYRLNAYRKNPCQRVILGDSRALAFDTEAIRDVSNKNYFNLGFGGASLSESFRALEYVMSIAELKEIVLVLPFKMFDASYQREYVSQAVKAIKNPLNYVLGYPTTVLSVKMIANSITGQKPKPSIPNMSKEDFWNSLLRQTDRSYKKYAYPTGYEEELWQLVERCKKNQIDIMIIIPPTHSGLQDKINEHNLSREYKKYKDLMHSLARTYDYDVKSSITVDSNNFKDPLHVNDLIMNKIIRDIWGESTR